MCQGIFLSRRKATIISQSGFGGKKQMSYVVVRVERERNKNELVQHELELLLHDVFQFLATVETNSAQCNMLLVALGWPQATNRTHRRERR